MTPELRDGWYLMSVADLEKELARRRGDAVEPSHAKRLSIADALAYRNAGNLPDENGRTLRLVLEITDAADLEALDKKRALFEPDFHDAPTWRRAGSVPVNVVPLRSPGITGTSASRWWEQPELAELEREWSERGTVEGLRVPAEYRSFVYKTVLSLKDARRPVTVETVVDSLARWMEPADLDRLAGELRRENSTG